VSTIDIGRDDARDAAQNELGKPIYPRASLTERLADWLDKLMHEILAKGSSVPGGWFTVTVLAVLLVVAVMVVIRVAMRTIRTNRGGAPALFGVDELGATQHRAAAEHAAAAGDWALAIRHRLRAVARHLEETSALDPVPGRTATELARDAAASVGALADKLRRAAITFNDVTYGQRPGTEAGYRLIAELDDQLCSGMPTGDVDSTIGDSNAGWSDLR
jgi:Domain of unknown function (DUF4129)